MLLLFVEDGANTCPCGHLASYVIFIKSWCWKAAPADTLDHFRAYLYHPHSISIPLFYSVSLTLSLSLPLCVCFVRFALCLGISLLVYLVVILAWLSSGFVPFIDCFCAFLSVRKSFGSSIFRIWFAFMLEWHRLFFLFSFCVTFKCRQIIHCGFECTAHCIHVVWVYFRELV